MRNNRFAKINRLVSIMIDLADIADTKSGDVWYLDNLGLGCRALSSYIRQGVKDIIDLEQDYYNTVEKVKAAAEAEDDMRAFLDDIFGEADVDCLGDADKTAIRDFVKKLFEEDM